MSDPVGRVEQTDEQKLAELGYKQELSRVWSSFTNFAISFTIISVLAGTFTTFGQAWNAGGPIAISIGWPVICAFVLLVAWSIGVLAFVPDTHQGVGWVFGHKINNTGFHGGATGGFAFWFLVMPIGFLLTMYTQTGYDASAHTAEETRGAAIGAAQGVWRSVFFSAIAGWIVLLALLFAVHSEKDVTAGGGGSIPIITGALGSGSAKLILIICTIGQIFCVTAGLTSGARTWYAFSRDRGMPGWPLFRRLNHHRVPTYAVIAVSFFSLVLTIPALWGTKTGLPFAIFALTGICTVGLYLAYIIPVYLRLRYKERFSVGPWNLGRHHRWIN